MGPFQTSKHLHTGLALHAQSQQKRNMRIGWHTEWLARHLPEALKDQPFTFTHGDLIKQNIMVQELPGADGQTDRYFLLTGLIDWELAGWYPQYWEYANLFIYAYWEGDWEAKAELFLDPHPYEAALLK
jgi:thiamine kinase-like enzyme